MLHNLNIFKFYILTKIMYTFIKIYQKKIHFQFKQFLSKQFWCIEKFQVFNNHLVGWLILQLFLDVWCTENSLIYLFIITLIECCGQHFFLIVIMHHEDEVFLIAVQYSQWFWKFVFILLKVWKFMMLFKGKNYQKI